MSIEVDIEVNTDIERLDLGFMLKDKFGLAMYGINTHRLNQTVLEPKAGERFTFRFDFTMLLGPGNYSLALSLTKSDSHLDGTYEWRDCAAILHVHNYRHEQFVGNTWLNAKVSVMSGGAA